MSPATLQVHHVFIGNPPGIRVSWSNIVPKAVREIVLNVEGVSVLTRLFVVKVAAVGASAVAGLGAGAAAGQHRQEPVSPDPSATLGSRALPTPSVPGSEYNIQVSVPAVPSRHALPRLCRAVLEFEQSSASAGPRRGTTPPSVNEIIQATGGSPRSAARWCATYLGFAPQPQPADLIRTTKPRATRKNAPAIHATLGLQSAQTIPVTEFGPLVSSS